MTLPVSMTDTAPDDRIRDAPRHHFSLDTGVVTWPCPRCATTLTAGPPASAGVGRVAVHECARPTANPDAPASRARVATWWDGYDAARENETPCRRNHVPDGSEVLIVHPSDAPAVYLTTGGGDTYLLTDRMVSGDDVFGTAHPVERAVLAARLAAMAALLAPTAEEARP